MSTHKMTAVGLLIFLAIFVIMVVIFRSFYFLLYTFGPPKVEFLPCIYIYCCASSFIHEIIILFFHCYTWTKLNILTIVQSLHTELGQSLSDFGKAVNLLGACEGNTLGKVFSELGAKSEILSIKLQKEVSLIVGSCIFVKQYWSSVKWNISL